MAKPDHDDTSLPANASEQQKREAGDRLRERIYATFTGLAVLMAMSGHGESLNAGTVLWTLFISVAGVLLAGLVSDLVSHMIVHNNLPTLLEFRHLVAVAARALTVIVIPAIMLGLAAFDRVDVHTAMSVSVIALIASLAVVAQIAVRRTTLPFLKKVIVLAVIVALGVAVVFLEQLAH